MSSNNGNQILVIGTLDTKSEEISYILNCLKDQGLEAVLMDGGIKGSPGLLAPDVTREEIAEAAGYTIDEVRSMEADEGTKISIMMKGAIKKALDLHKSGQLKGVLAIGGSMGTSLCSGVMRAFPFGFPKVMLSTMASRDVRLYVGTTDMVMQHTVADLIGLNFITRHVLEDAALAMSGMVKGIRRAGATRDNNNKKLISLTTKGPTEACCQTVRKKLEEQGYETVTFTTSGVGGMAMEDLIAQGTVDIVVDLSLFDVADQFCGRYGHQPGGPDRLLAAIDRKIPLLVAPGNSEYFAHGPYETSSKMFPGRPWHIHNYTITVYRYTPEELEIFGVELAKRLNLAEGPVAAVIPLKGFSNFSIPTAGFNSVILETTSGPPTTHSV